MVIFEKKSGVKVQKNQKIKHFIFFLLFISSLTASAHPFFVSICEINYNAENQSLEISLRTFTDDLEKGLQDWGAGKLYLGESNESMKADSVLKDYIFKILSIEVDQKNTNLEYLGKEVERELTWVYLEVKHIPDFDEISVSDRLLFQTYSGQTNLIHVNHRNKIKSLLLTTNNPIDSLEWDKE